MLPRIGLILIALIAVAFPASAQDLPQELAGCRVVKLWQFETNSAGWLPDHNVSNFTSQKGVLHFENTGFDPWILNPKPDVDDVSRCAFLGVKMRSSAAGINQVYFTTSKAPSIVANGEVAGAAIGDDRFRLYEFNMSERKGWTGELTLLRLDTVNGGLAKGAEIDIDWIALYSKPAALQIRRPSVTRTASGAAVSLPMENTGSEPFRRSVTIRRGSITRDLGRMKPGDVVTPVFACDADAPAVDFAVHEGRRHLLQASLILPSEIGEGCPVISSRHTALVFDASAGVREAALYSRTETGDILMAILRPLATLVYRDAEGVVHYEEISADKLGIEQGQLALLQSTRQPNGGLASFTWSFSLPPDGPAGSITCEMSSSVPIEILRFEGPRLLVGENGFGSAKTSALFPGLEYLEAGEISSSDDYVGPKCAVRRVPHPFKVTVPLMAVEHEGSLVGLTWDPHSEWAPGESLPSAEFESPALGRGQSNHLLTLFAPSIPEYVKENSGWAERPYPLEAGGTMKLSWDFFALPGRITDAVPLHLSTAGVPDAPVIPRGVDGVIDLCFRAYTETLFSPEKGGWKTHIGLNDANVPRNEYAATVLAESVRRVDPTLAGKCGITPGAQLATYTGTTLDWFAEATQKASYDLVSTQSPDGGFPYSYDEAMRERVKGHAGPFGIDRDTLGRAGETNAGYIATRLLPILNHALFTGDSVSAAAAIRGLEKSNSYSIPRGAGTWEVPLQTPDVLAAGRLVDVNLRGYQLTGKESYLDHARFWAYAGLPFIYLWKPPVQTDLPAVLHYDDGGEGKGFVLADASEFYRNTVREVCPGASIPVFGTSFYVVSWFGQPVQWCGQVWANSVREYIKLRPDSLLQRVADMVFASIAQQQVELGPFAGTYTDVWGIEPAGNSPVFIGPNLILEYAYDLKGEKLPTQADTIGIDVLGRRCLLSSFASILSASVDAENSRINLKAFLKHFPGQDLYLCVANCALPSSARVDSMALEATTDLRAAASGWWYDEPNSALHIKSRPSQRDVTVQVSW